MTNELYQKARFIKCQINDLNETLDTIERLRKKYKNDSELEIILQNTHAHNFNEIQKLKHEFDTL